MSYEPQELIDTMLKLQEWINNFEGLSEVPVVSCTFSEFTEDICIGEVGVYCSEGCTPDEDVSLIDHCKGEFLEHARNMAIFAGTGATP